MKRIDKSDMDMTTPLGDISFEGGSISGGAGDDTLRLSGGDLARRLDGKALLGEDKVRGIGETEVVSHKGHPRTLDPSRFTAKEFTGLSDADAALKVRGDAGTAVDPGDGYTKTEAGRITAPMVNDLDGDRVTDIYIQRDVAEVI